MDTRALYLYPDICPQCQWVVSFQFCLVRFINKHPLIKCKHSGVLATEQWFAYLHLLVIKLNLVFFISCNNYIKRCHHNERHKETPDCIDQEAAKT